MDTFYQIMAAVTFMGVFLFTPPSNTVGDFMGSLGLGLVWPIVVAALIYYSIKKLVFGLHGPSDRYFPLEITLCAMVGGAAALAMACYHNPAFRAELFGM